MLLLQVAYATLLLPMKARAAKWCQDEGMQVILTPNATCVFRALLLARHSLKFSNDLMRDSSPCGY
jgi:hypothetical protein